MTRASWRRRANVGGDVNGISRYLAGDLLYGDDFDATQIAAWFADEQEAYADLGAKNAAKYTYAYHAWNIFHGFRRLPPGPVGEVLGFGSAYGEELLPIVPRARSITIVEPSGAFTTESLQGVPVRYIRPVPGGELPFPDNSFGLITCFGVLHHIPNVSAAIKEFARVLRRDGRILLREPIVSMGDWRKPRPGLTKRERGIPLAVLERIASEAGLDRLHRSLCGFPLTRVLFNWKRSGPFNDMLATRVDAVLAAAFAWNWHYHARSTFERLRSVSTSLRHLPAAFSDSARLPAAAG